MLSIGTGVVAYRCVAGGSPSIRAGWGFPVADRGGGAWLGLRLATEYLDHLDGAAAIPDSTLWPVAEACLGRDRESILASLGAATPATFAALAPAVVAAAQAGDPLGTAILDEGGVHLMRLAQAVLAGTTAKLALGGGLAGVYRSRLAAGLGGDLLGPGPPPEPLRGAWLVGTGQAPAEYRDVG